MYIVVAVTFSDGEMGRRVWSHEFRTRLQAEACMAWLKKTDQDLCATIFDDFEED